jgi:hypothetical protein
VIEDAVFLVCHGFLYSSMVTLLCLGLVSFYSRPDFYQGLGTACLKAPFGSLQFHLYVQRHLQLFKILLYNDPDTDSDFSEKVFTTDRLTLRSLSCASLCISFDVNKGT